MDAPPIHRLVDLVHVFKGIVVEQFEKWVEKLPVIRSVFGDCSKFYFSKFYSGAPGWAIDSWFVHYRYWETSVIPSRLLWRPTTKQRLASKLNPPVSMGTPKTLPNRMPGQDRVSSGLVLPPQGERKETEEEEHMIWECRWKICSSDFGSWARQVAPTVTNLSLQNPWARGSRKRRQFTRSLLSSRRNSLGKLQQMGVLGEALQICG